MRSSTVEEEVALPPIAASPLVTFGIPAVALGVAALVVWAVRAAAPRRAGLAAVIVGAWIALFSMLATAGVFARADLRPPPFAALFVLVLAGGLALGLSPLGGAVARGVPLWALVAFQAFRLPLELVMHRAAAEGVMPAEMTFGSGYNYDILTGVGAIAVAAALRRGAGAWLAVQFALMSGLLLAVIVGVALAASPLVHAFGPPPHVNSWVGRFPFVLLPAVCVAGALAGQIVLVRRLRAGASGAASTA